MTLKEIANTDMTMMHAEALGKAKVMAMAVICEMFQEFECKESISSVALDDLKDAVKVLYMIKELKKV